MGGMRPPGPTAWAAACRAARHPHVAHSPPKQEVPVPAGIHNTTHSNQAQHICLLKWPLGAFSRSIPTNTFPYNQCTAGRLLLQKRQSTFLPVSQTQCHTWPCKVAMGGDMVPAVSSSPGSDTHPRYIILGKTPTSLSHHPSSTRCRLQHLSSGITARTAGDMFVINCLHRVGTQ